MKEQIYKAITENRGYVVNIDYDKFLHWNCEDSSFIILGKGENLNLYIDNYEHLIAEYNHDDEFKQEHASWNYLAKNISTASDSLKISLNFTITFDYSNDPYYTKIPNNTQTSGNTSAWKRKV